MQDVLRTYIHSVLLEKTVPDVVIEPGLHPWPKLVLNIGFRAASKSGVGPGEERLAAMWNGQTFGQGVSMDVQAGDGTRWEVKMPDGKQCSGRVRLEQEGIRALEHPLSVLKTVTKKLLRIFDVNNSANAELLASVFDHNQIAVIREFLFGRGGINSSGIMRGEIGMERIAGLKDVLVRCAGSLNRTEYLKTRRTFKDTKLSLTNQSGQSFALEVDREQNVETLIGVARKFGISVKQPFVTDEEHLQAKFFAGSKAIFKLAFTDPDAFIEKYWKNAVRPSEVFGDVDGVVLVSEEFYRVIPRNQIDSVFFLHSISKGKPKLAARKVEASQDEALPDE